MKLFGPGVDSVRSSVAFTAAAVTGAPPLNVMPSRSVKVSVSRSSEYAQLSAAFGLSSPLLSTVRSVS